MARNIASGNDNVPVQVGRVLGRRRTQDDDATPTATDTTAEQTGQPIRTTNIRSGNARVGVQLDEVHGDLNIRR